VRLFTFDRPGIGLSTLQPRRRILDWPRDVAEFADAYGLDRFRVLGWSGGAPYALATAYELSDRVTRVGLVAPMSPLAGTSLTRELAPDLRRRARVGRLAPWLLRVAVARDRRAFTRDPARFLEREFAKSPACDRAVLDNPGLKQMLIDNQSEAYRQGPRGLSADARLFLHPWGFEASQVRVPIQLWLGERDETLSPAMGRYFADELVDSDTTYVTGEGHMLCLIRWEQILRDLAGRA
jgi:pimeloyl-ACP methyl ester carboxylesterase